MEKLKKAALPALAAAALFILSGAEFYNLRPFGTGAFLALSLTALPIYITAPVYLVSQAAFCFAMEELWGYAAICVAVTAVKLIFMRLNKRMPLWAGVAAVAVGSCGFIYAALIKSLTPLGIILSALFSLLFAVICLTFIKPVFDYKLKYRLLETETVCGCCILAASGLSLIRPVLGPFSFAFTAAAAVTLYALSLKGTGAGIVCALSLGCGFALSGLDSRLIALAVFPAALAAAFKNGHRLLSAAGYMLGLIMAVYLFSAGDSYTLLSAAIGCLPFIATPAKRLKTLKAAFCSAHYRDALTASYNRERRQAGAELNVAADIFSQMSEVTGKACGVTLDCLPYAKNLIERVCGGCPYGEGCVCKNEKVMESLLIRAVEDGRTSVGGLPASVSENCRNLGQLIAAAGAIVEKSKDDLAAGRAYEGAARLICSQLKGAERVMRKLSGGLCADAELDKEGADKLIEELTYRGCACSDAVVRRDRRGSVFATAFVREENFDNAAALAALRKIYGQPFFFVSLDREKSPDGFTAALFKSGSPLDVTFGVSQLSKDGSGVSGDTHAFTRIGADGFMMALSDGMGSGSGANEVSQTAVGLVENYYKAGFDSQFVLSSVNSFLSLRPDENFSAMDVLVLDLNSGSGDVIKIGCPATIVKRADKAAVIGGGSLPLGALEEITPYSLSVKFQLDDMIFMMSDGVSDAFNEGEAEAFISSLDTLNPQTASKAVLQAALDNIGGTQKDDMTVLCGRIFQRI